MFSVRRFHCFPNKTPRFIYVQSIMSQHRETPTPQDQELLDIDRHLILIFLSKLFVEVLFYLIYTKETLANWHCIPFEKILSEIVHYTRYYKKIIKISSLKDAVSFTKKGFCKMRMKLSILFLNHKCKHFVIDTIQNAIDKHGFCVFTCAN